MRVLKCRNGYTIRIELNENEQVLINQIYNSPKFIKRIESIDPCIKLCRDQVAKGGIYDNHIRIYLATGNVFKANRCTKEVRETMRQLIYKLSYGGSW